MLAGLCRFSRMGEGVHFFDFLSFRDHPHSLPQGPSLSRAHNVASPSDASEFSRLSPSPLTACRYLCTLLDHSESERKKVKSLSRARLFATPWTVACATLLRPWDFQGKSTGVGCHFLLQGIFPTQGSNPGLLHCRQTIYHLSHQGSERLLLNHDAGILGPWRRRIQSGARDEA